VDTSQFDRLARTVGEAATRRTALQGLAAGVLGAIGLSAASNDTDAQRRRRKRRRKRRNRGGRLSNCGAQYAGCNSDNDCCRGLTCKTLTNPHAEQRFSGTCAYQPAGCGKRNDFCERNHDCCRAFICRGRQCRRRK
jgi:hypothetical protein